MAEQTTIGQKLYELINPYDPAASCNPAQWHQVDEDWQSHYERAASAFLSDGAAASAVWDQAVAKCIEAINNLDPQTGDDVGSFRVANALAQLLNERKWRPISEMPSRKSAFIFFRNTLGKGRIVKAMYAKKFEIEQDACDAEFCDYNEEADKYYWPEGWYEDVYAETGLDYSFHHLGDIKPDGWLPLPPSPEESDDA